jgi:SH3 domain-containing YSC84-like protein 1
MMEWVPAREMLSSTSRRNKFMRKIISTLMALALTALPTLAAPDNDRETDRLENAGSVLEEILNVPDDIPQDLLDKAECVIIFPSVLKFAIGFGGSYGRGAMICRTGEHYTGPWGAPSMAALEGGSFGLQLGGQATDFVLLIMNPRGAQAILSSKVKLGADMAAAAGPKGRDATAATDATLRAEILSYSRSRGLFAGISLEGSTLRPDGDANEKIYGKKVSAEDVVRRGAVPVPPSARKMVALLNKKSPKNLSDPDSLK